MKTNMKWTGLRASALALTFLSPVGMFAAPSISTLPASGVTYYQAVLNGQAYVGGQAATAWFEYGPTTNYGNRAGNFVFQAGTSTFPATAVSFNGSNQDATVVGFGNYAPTNEVTIEFWQKVVDAQAQSSFVLNPDFGTNRINSHDPWLDGNSYWDFGNIDTSGRLYVADTGVIGSWVNIALVASQSSNYMSIYTNGVLLATKSGMTPFERYDADLLLAGGAEGINFFNGAMAEFRVWNRALDQATIQAWMNRPLNNTHPYWTNLVAYWPMNEGSGDVLIDQSGNGHDAGLNNSPTWLALTNVPVAATAVGLTAGTTYHYAPVLDVGGEIIMGQDSTFTTPPATDLTASLPLKVLHAFNGTDDGADLYSDLLLADGMLYGVTYSGGTNGAGTVFAVNTSGGGFTNLHTFSASQYDGSAQAYTNSDGVGPVGGLVLSGNTLYGVTYEAGPTGYGTVFALKTDGSAFTNLHNFSYTNDGGNPYGKLTLSSNKLYGTTYDGGSNGYGTVFALNTDGSDFATLHTFDYTNDGGYPAGALVVSGRTLYGTTYEGGSGTNYYGTAFELNTDGTGFSVLHFFTYYGADGGYPWAGLTLSGGTLYGAAGDGGVNWAGTIFSLETNGLNFTTLYSFTGGADGGYPYASLILAGNTLYGAASSGGSQSYGTLFRLQTDGSALTTLHDFYYPTDGGLPYYSPLLFENTLYGTTYRNGPGGGGTVFSLPLGPELAIARAGSNVVLTWPTNEAGFSLQSTTNLAESPNWSPVSPLPDIVDGQFTVTNATTGNQAFFWLSPPIYYLKD